MLLGMADTFVDDERNLEWIDGNKDDGDELQYRGSNAVGTEVCFSVVPSEKGTFHNPKKVFPGGMHI